MDVSASFSFPQQAMKSTPKSSFRYKFYV